MTDNKKINSDFTIALCKIFTGSYEPIQEEVFEIFRKFPEECREYVFVWKPVVKNLSYTHAKTLDILSEEIKAFDEKPILVPEPIKLVVHEKELVMYTHFNDVYKATHNSNLMMAVVEQPNIALDNLRNRLYSLEEINYPNSNGWTPLMYVARHSKNIENSIEIMKELIKQGASVNQRSFLNNYILFMVAIRLTSTSSIEALDLLLKNPNILINVKNHKSSLNVLTEAVKCSASDSSVECVQRLLEHPDIDPNLVDENCMDALLHGLQCLDGRKEIGFYSTSKDALILLIKSPKYKLNLKDKLEWITKNSKLNGKNYLEIIMNLYKEHNPSGIYL